MNSEMKARIALAGYWLTVIFLTASAGAIIYKLIFWPLCTSSGPQVSNCTVVDSWTIAGVTATVLGVSATLLAILGALAVAVWWTGLEERVSKQIAKLVEEQKQELYKTREALIYMSSGDQLLSQKQVTEALEDFKKAKNLLPKDPHLNYVLSNYFLDVGDYNTAIAALNDAQFRDVVDQAKVQRKLGLAYRHRWEDLKRDQDFDLALQYLKDAAISNPNDSKTFTLLGGLYRRKHEYDEALHWYDRARHIDQAPSSYTLGHIATLLWFQGKVSEARKYFYETEAAATALIKKRPSEVYWYYFDLGLTQLVAGKIDAAKLSYEKAIQMTPFTSQLDTTILEDLYLIRQAPQPMPGLDEIIKLIEHATAPM